jgi:hypothetical protein
MYAGDGSVVVMFVKKEDVERFLNNAVFEVRC